MCQSAFMFPGYLSSGYLSSGWRFFFFDNHISDTSMECLLYIDKIRTRRLDPRYSWKYWYFQEYEHKKGTFCAIVRHGDKSGWRCLEGELAISLKTGQTPSLSIWYGHHCFSRKIYWYAWHDWNNKSTHTGILSCFSPPLSLSSSVKCFYISLSSSISSCCLSAAVSVTVSAVSLPSPWEL